MYFMKYCKDLSYNWINTIRKLVIVDYQSSKEVDGEGILEMFFSKQLIILKYLKWLKNYF